MDLGARCKHKNHANVRGKQPADDPGMGIKTQHREALRAQLPGEQKVLEKQRLPTLCARA